MAIVLWYLGKLVFYAVMAGLAIAILRLYVRNAVGFLLGYALLRVLIGIVAGFVIYFVGAELGGRAGVVGTYLLTFGAVRYLEWLLMLWLICKNQDVDFARNRWRGQIWILIGVGGNILLDMMAVWFVMPTIKFYC